jgi:site-specific DNA-methyltransferase (adenine-specific)
MKVTDKITITNEDNMLLMARYPDKYFDLAIVDPPYGMDKSSTNGSGKLKNRALNKMNTDWDIAPNKEYFEELFRVSKNQIIWGGNYFNLPPTRCVLCWDKKQMMPTFSRWEMAWTSFYKPAKLFALNNADANKIHPTQKPIELYYWLLSEYTEPKDKILDTHLGSGSIAIACHDYGFDLTACELDKEYFEKAMQRIQNHTNQTKLF